MNRSFVFTAFLFVLFVDGAVLAQEQKCELLPTISSSETTFERKGDLSIFRSKFPAVLDARADSISIEVAKTLIEKKNLNNCEILQFDFEIFSAGTWVKRNDEINFSFESISNKFLYDSQDDRRLVFEGDGKELFSAVMQQKFRDDLSKSIKREHLWLQNAIDIAVVGKLAEAKDVSIKLGKRTFRLTTDQHRAIVDFYDEINRANSADKAVR